MLTTLVISCCLVFIFLQLTNPYISLAKNAIKHTTTEKVYEIIPYSKLNTTISNCPNGFPFALNIKDVTPISDAGQVE